MSLKLVPQPWKESLQERRFRSLSSQSPSLQWGHVCFETSLSGVVSLADELALLPCRGTPPACLCDNGETRGWGFLHTLSVQQHRRGSDPGCLLCRRGALGFGNRHTVHPEETGKEAFC